MNYLIKISIIFGVLIILNECTFTPKPVSTVQVSKPGFATFIPSTDSARYHLAVSSFNGAPFSQDFVTFYANFSINGSYSKMTQLNNKNLVWPNEISYTNKTILTEKVDPYGGVLVPGGFLVPSKDNGGIFYYPFLSKDRSEITNDAPYELTLNSQGKTKWFYHRVKLVDVTGDGHDDLLTCRTFKPIVGQTQVQLVAFVLDTESLVYVEKIILNDYCDVFFDVADLDHDGRVEIIAAGYFVSKLSIIYSDDPKNSFLNGNVKIINIDNLGSHFFDVQLTNLDNIGNMELLVTNHQGTKDQVKGAVYYFILNGKNIRTGTWKKYIIYDNFPVLKSGINQAAPGVAKPFFPDLKNQTLPYIFVSGDGAEKAYLFEPQYPNAKSNALNYKLVWTEYYKGYTVGGVSIADLNGDGINELIVAIYESNTCYVYTFQQ